MSEPSHKLSPRRERLYEIIFEADTPAGRRFDIVLLIAIVASAIVVMLDSVAEARLRFGLYLQVAEWILTLGFTVELILRLISARRPGRYLRSFFGIVDVLSIAPSYLSLFIPGAQSLIVIRLLRLLRVFRVLKLAQFLREASQLRAALHESARKIIVFFGTLLTIVVIMGAVMYLIEGESNGFTSIPRGVYWAIVTMTTVGYGDIAPQTVVGQFVAATLMVTGYAIIAVPTGIVSVELAHAAKHSYLRVCSECRFDGHDSDARHCKRCGCKLAAVAS